MSPGIVAVLNASPLAEANLPGDSTSPLANGPSSGDLVATFSRSGRRFTPSVSGPRPPTPPAPRLPIRFVSGYYGLPKPRFASSRHATWIKYQGITFDDVLLEPAG